MTRASTETLAPTATNRVAPVSLKDVRGTRACAERLVASAERAKVRMGSGYGTDVTDLSPDDYKARIRAIMRAQAT